MSLAAASAPRGRRPRAARYRLHCSPTSPASRASSPTCAASTWCSNGSTRSARSCRNTTRAATCKACRKQYTGKGVVWLAINSTNPAHSNFRDESRSAQILKDWKMIPTALSLDKDGKVGQAYGARTTPHMFVIDPNGTVIYAGGIDDKATLQSRRREKREEFRCRGAGRVHGWQAGIDAERSSVRMLRQVLIRARWRRTGRSRGPFSLALSAGLSTIRA